jgi:5'-nucleotidase
LVLTIGLLASFGCSNYKPLKYKAVNDEVSPTYSPDKEAELIISAYRVAIDSVMNISIGRAAHTLSKGTPEGSLGNFCSDAVYDRSIGWLQKEGSLFNIIAVDFALLNNGGLRVPLDSGEITIGNIYELMPFENEIVLVELSGRKMIELIAYIQNRTILQGRKSGVPVSTQFNLQLDTINNRVSCSINEQPFDSQRNYIIATSDYLATGGDQMTFFTEPIKIINTSIKIRDALIGAIQEIETNGKQVSNKIDGRISYAR